MLYAVQAVAQSTSTFPDSSLDGTRLRGASHRCTRQLPTFYLDSSVQGIVDARHAESIASRLLTHESSLRDVSVSVNACAVSSVLVPSDVASAALDLLRRERSRLAALARADRPMVAQGADSGRRMRAHEADASRYAEMADALAHAIGVDAVAEVDD